MFGQVHTALVRPVLVVGAQKILDLVTDHAPSDLKLFFQRETAKVVEKVKTYVASPVEQAGDSARSVEVVLASAGCAGSMRLGVGRWLTYTAKRRAIVFGHGTYDTGRPQDIVAHNVAKATHGGEFHGFGQGGGIDNAGGTVKLHDDRRRVN
ncbi:hypothetical protein N7520_005631 [Penicillium odoratum]|uniref:uncharacterized protein n=1 Tax=Penicillium odoratum TaxID=1167516 RepID=UPI002547029A|nr:uncharacterized protein N7520_005631 [Penicillium odoratum]KAJ5758475.1 hypothetical protein N7520_005631 [Penicillium odoratum]